MVNDGSLNSTASTKTVSITAVNTPPTVTDTGGTTAWTEATGLGNNPAVVIDSGVTVSDPGSTTLASATVSITGGFQSGQDVLVFNNNGSTMGNIAGSYNSSTGVLSLTSSGATATLAQWQAALDAVTYNNSSHNPNTANRTISFVVNDGSLNSTASTKTVSVTAVDTPPTVTDTGGTTAWTEASGTGPSTPVVIDSGLTVSDPDNTTLASATMSITGGFQSSQDVLAFSNTSSSTYGNIAGSYNSSTGVLSLTSSGATATLAQWQAALDAVTYNNSSLNPNTANRTISFVVNDGSVNSAASTKTVSITAVNTPPTTVIEADGSTSLVEVGSNFFFYPVGGSSGPELSYSSAPFVAGQFGNWTPIGVEQTASGYEVAWKVTGADQYTVWNTDSSGNYLSNAIGVVSGSSVALESFEPGFHQDLNSDGVIGVPNETTGTSLVEVGSNVGSNFFFYPVGGSSGPELKYSGTPVVAGQFGAWTPFGVEQMASGGYEVAWQLTGTDQYTVWNTDSTGNYVSNAVGVVSGSTISMNNGVIVIAIGSAQTVEITSAYSGNVTFTGSSGTLKIDNSASFTGNVTGMTGQDTIDFADINPAKVQPPSYSGSAAGGTLTVTDGSHTAKVALVGNYLGSTFVPSSDGNGGTNVIDPPAPTGSSAAQTVTVTNPPANSSTNGDETAALFARTAALLAQFAAAGFQNGPNNGGPVGAPLSQAHSADDTPFLTKPHS